LRENNKKNIISIQNFIFFFYFISLNEYHLEWINDYLYMRMYF